MKFIADIMVGKLARYLRMAGADVLYRNDYSDEEILRIAKQEGRTILTRDALMLQRKDCRDNIISSLFIKSSRLEEQLRQVKSVFDIKLEPKLIRCIECNSLLEYADRNELEDKVPPYVYKTQNTFLFCQKCNKYYWRGTHYDNIHRAFKIVSSSELEHGDGS
jgi:hypothetical protein